MSVEHSQVSAVWAPHTASGQRPNVPARPGSAQGRFQPGFCGHQDRRTKRILRGSEPSSLSASASRSGCIDSRLPHRNAGHHHRNAFALCAMGRTEELRAEEHRGFGVDRSAATRCSAPPAPEQHPRRLRTIAPQWTFDATAASGRWAELRDPCGLRNRATAS